MYINKSTARVLQFFVGHITESFTLREVARRLKMHVSLAHRAIKPLIEEKIVFSKLGLVIIDEQHRPQFTMRPKPCQSH